MIRKIAMLLSGAILSSCSTILTDETAESSDTATLSFSVKSLELSSMTRAAVDASTVLKTLDLALYTKDASGNLTYYKSVSQDVSSTESCKVTLEGVVFGTYTLVALGNASSFGGHSSTLESPKQVSYTDGVVPIVYRATQELTVDKTTDEVTLTLSPTVASFRIYLSDAIPTGMTGLKFEVSNASSSTYLDATTGLAPSDKLDAWSRTVEVPADKVGTTNLNARINLFLTAADLTGNNAAVNITVSAVKSDGSVIHSHAFTKVPLKIGSVTAYTGNFFKNDKSFAVQVENTWGDLSGSY